MSKLTYGPKRQFNHISRYSSYRVITNASKNLAYFESPNCFANITDKDTIYHVVEPTQEGRLDIISNIYYGTPIHFWAIAWTNNIIDPLTVIKGTVLTIPSIDSLYSKGGPLENI